MEAKDVEQLIQERVDAAKVELAQLLLANLDMKLQELQMANQARDDEPTSKQPSSGDSVPDLVLGSGPDSEILVRGHLRIQGDVIVENAEGAIGVTLHAFGEGGTISVWNSDEKIVAQLNVIPGEGSASLRTNGSLWVGDLEGAGGIYISRTEDGGNIFVSDSSGAILGRFFASSEGIGGLIVNGSVQIKDSSNNTVAMASALDGGACYQS